MYKIDVLGQEYTISIVSESEDPKLKANNGYCDCSTYEIVICNSDDLVGDIDAVKDMKAFIKQVTRHEIIHAFLCESGLQACSCATNCWAYNEEMIDWFAIQSPKIIKAFKDAKCI